MVIYAVILHWATVVARDKSGPEVFRIVVKTRNMKFYADDSLLASPRPARLQEALDVLMCLFYWVGLRKNVDKMVGMICQPCRTSDRHFEVSYTWQMMLECPSHSARQ